MRRTLPCSSAAAARAVVAVGLGLTVLGRAQAAVDDAVAQALVQQLASQGFENVAAHAEGDRLTVTYENRRNRWQVAGVGAALAAVASQVPGDTEIVLVPQEQGVPQMRLAVFASDYTAFNTGQLSEAEFRRKLTVTYSGTSAARGLCPTGRNRSYGRTDLSGGLQLHGNFYTPDSNAGIEARELTGAEMTVARGLGLGAQAIVPTRGFHPLLGQMQLSWVNRPADHWFLGTAIGRLAETMDGASVEAAVASSDARQVLRAQAAFGHDREFGGNGRALLVTYSFRLARPEVGLSLTAGQFWGGDRGFEADLTSGFGERRITLGVGRSGGVTRATVAFRTPFGPRLQPRPAAVRLKMSDYFNVRYSAPQGNVDPSRVGGSIPPSFFSRVDDGLSPWLVENYLSALKTRAPESH